MSGDLGHMFLIRDLGAVAVTVRVPHINLADMVRTLVEDDHNLQCVVCLTENGYSHQVVVTLDPAFKHFEVNCHSCGHVHCLSCMTDGVPILPPPPVYLPSPYKKAPVYD